MWRLSTLLVTLVVFECLCGSGQTQDAHGQDESSNSEDDVNSRQYQKNNQGQQYQTVPSSQHYYMYQRPANPGAQTYVQKLEQQYSTQPQNYSPSQQTPAIRYQYRPAFRNVPEGQSYQTESNTEQAASENIPTSAAPNKYVTPGRYKYYYDNQSPDTCEPSLSQAVKSHANWRTAFSEDAVKYRYGPEKRCPEGYLRRSPDNTAPQTQQ